MDAGMLEQVLISLHNWFERDTIAVTNCEIRDGLLPASAASGLMPMQWYRIQGSVFNDGLHQHPDEYLEDETFTGTITALAIPRALLNVADEIEDWLDRYNSAREKAQSSPYQSESFDGYSYSIRSDLSGNTASGGLTGWQAEYASRLNPWRKMY